MTYQEAIAFIESIPRFSPGKPAGAGREKPLESAAYLLALLGEPQKKLRFVHIAGTNGKGSTAAFTAKILEESGLLTGLYTSPALERFTERIRAGGQEISRRALARLTDQVQEAYARMEREGRALPSQFEVVCAIALLYFCERGCDVVVLEVGMGGRLDATNVIPVPELALITTISLDHMQILGNSLPQIAREKAGIIKEGGTVLLYPQDAEVSEVFRRVCRERGASLIVARLDVKVKERGLEGQVFDLQVGEETFSDLKIRLLGSYQTNNAAMAVNAACLLRHKGWPISQAAIRRGLAQTLWPGRFELMGRRPEVIVDGGHNEEGARVLRDNLERLFAGRRIWFVCGVLADKAYDRMLDQLLPLAEFFYTITPRDSRALPAEQLAAYLQGQGARAAACGHLEEALLRAREGAGPEGIVCVFGSLSTVGQVRRLLQQS